MTETPPINDPASVQALANVLRRRSATDLDRMEASVQGLANVIRRRSAADRSERVVCVPPSEVTIDNTPVAEAIQQMSGMIRAMREETILYAANVRELAAKPVLVQNDVKPADVHMQPATVAQLSAPDVHVHPADVHVQAADLSGLAGLAEAVREQTAQFAEFMVEMRKLLKPRKRKLVKDASGEITGWEES